MCGTSSARTGARASHTRANVSIVAIFFMVTVLAMMPRQGSAGRVSDRRRIGSLLEIGPRSPAREFASAKLIGLAAFLDCGNREAVRQAFFCGRRPPRPANFH